MQGIFVQLTRLSFLIILWWLIFRVISTIRRDFYVAKTTKTKSRLSQIGFWKITKLHSNDEVEMPHIPYPNALYSAKAQFLVVTHGSLSGTKITLSDTPILVGRSPSSTLVINDDYSSSYHAKLTKSGSQWYVEDLGSTNGTFLNHSRINTSTTVPLNTPIRVGKTVFELQP